AGLHASLRRDGTLARACARDGRNFPSTGLRNPDLAGQPALQHVACDDQHRVAQQVWRVAAEGAQSFDDNRLYLGDAQATRAEEWRSQAVLHLHKAGDVAGARWVALVAQRQPETSLRLSLVFACWAPAQSQLGLGGTNERVVGEQLLVG